jgi:hypothetical protein
MVRIFICFIAALLPVCAHAEAFLEAAPEGSFSIVVIPDTQGYRIEETDPESNGTVTNSVFANHVRWISQNLATQHVAFVSHVGDIVDKNSDAQWTIAREHMDVLHGNVPYGIVVGNHDMTSKGDSSLFQKYFPASRYADFAWYGGTFVGDKERPGHSSNNANSFQLFSAGGHDFIIFHLECNAPDNVVAWANGLLETHAERWAIISTHMDLGPMERPKERGGYVADPKGRMRWKKCHQDRGNTPEQLWGKLYRKHPRLIMVCSGDQSRTSAMYLPRVGDHGNVVHGLLSDYTSSGPLRIYRFLPDESQIRVITYDTTTEKLVRESRYVRDYESHQFSIDWKF